MKTLWLILAIGVVLVLAGLGFVYSGLYDVAADRPHTSVAYNLLDRMRKRSVAVRADDVAVRDIDDPKRLRTAAREYDAMCAMCHLAPGMEPTEIHRGLYPMPPDFTRRGRMPPEEDFWIIKHGLKFTGMAAWGESHSDEEIWSLVALVQAMPELDADEYRALVPSAGNGGRGGHHGQPGAGPASTPESDAGHEHDTGGRPLPG